MEQLTTYTIKAKQTTNVWLFKYHLNGALYQFKVLEGTLSQTQIDWLFKKANFPHQESQIRDWQLKLKQNFEIVVGEPDFSFDALWNAYNYKVKRHEAEKRFNQLKQADIVKCFMAIKGYLKHISNTKTAQAHLSTYINQRYFEDDWSKA